MFEKPTTARQENLQHAQSGNKTLSGEHFENTTITRLVSELRDPVGYWEDLDENIPITTFDNEWQRLYQMIRNEDPLSTLGWRSRISNDILGIIEQHHLHEDKEDSDNEGKATYDIEAIFSELDHYFDAKNIDPRFIPTTIDLLFQVQELEKAEYGAFDDPTEEIDQRIHEYRDVSFRDILSRYVETRLKPRLNTVFEKLKYEAVMDAWENFDSDYTDFSEITLPEEQLRALIKESNANRSVKSFHHHDRFSLMITLTKDYFAEYVSNDSFYVVEKDADGQYNPIAIKDLLQKSGVSIVEENNTVGDYRSLMDLRVRASLEKAFGFKLLDLTLKEQYFFLNYLKRITPEFVETIKQFTSLYGVDGMRTFLSLERGDETLGDHIVAFGQHNEVASTVFKYYGELLNSAERAEALVRELSDCEGDICIELGNQVRENIINRAQQDLEKAVRSRDPGEVAAQIENYVAAAKEYVALLQEVGAGKIESVAPESLTEEEKARMQELLRNNYNKAYPEPEKKAFKAAVAASLTKSFSNPKTTFRVLRHNGKIVSYLRFDTLSDYTGKEVSYFGSFNADPAYNGVGGVMLEETIKDRLKDGRLMMAYTDPNQPITKKYIEDGFIATNTHDFAGKSVLEIWRSKDSTTQLESKERSIEDLLATTESESIVVREQSSSESYPELRKNMGLTRYFTHQGKTYLVFEKLPNNLRNDFTPPKEELKQAA